MHPETILEQLKAQPYQPLRLYMSDGSYHDVPHPEIAMVSRRHVTIAVEFEPSGLVSRTVITDPLHVTRIEPIPDIADEA